MTTKVIELGDIDLAIEKKQEAVDVLIAQQANLNAETLMHISLYVDEKSGTMLIVSPKSLPHGDRRAQLLISAAIMDSATSEKGSTGEDLNRLAIKLLRASYEKTTTFMLVVADRDDLVEVQGTMGATLASKLLPQAANHIATTEPTFSDRTPKAPLN